MWSWREWRRERQMRKQLDETLKTKKRQPFGSSSAGATPGSGAAGDGPATAIAQTPSVALLVQVGQQLDRRAPITLSIVVTALLGGSSPFVLMNDTTFLHEVISFAWTGYYLEKKLGGLRFLLVLAYLLVLSQVLLTVTAFVMAKTIFYSELLVQWTVGFSSVLWALKVVMTRQYPTLAPGLDIKVPTNYLTWIELLGVHIFLPRLALLSQISGLAAGYLFTVIPGTMKLLAKYELQVDRALRKQGIKLPVKHRWKLVIADFGHSIKATKWWPRFRKCKATGA